jgi:choline dehydrogenase-like flavoprotein
VQKKEKVIIVGGGTAGLVIANSIQNHFNVTVIERSKYKRYPVWYRVPLLIGLLFKSKKSKYVSIRESVLSNGRVIPFFESCLLGGASVMNGCVHMLGNRVKWQSILRQFDTNYDDLLTSYHHLYELGSKDKNKISLRESYQGEIGAAFVSALNNKGVPCGDMNYSDGECCGPVLNTVRKYFRTSVLTLIKKIKFKLILDENAESLLLDGQGNVIGVKTDSRSIYSDFVILSGGVVGTCGFLLKEGFKNNKASNFLNNLSIGKDIRDHTNLRVNVLTNKNINSLNEISDSFFKKIQLVFKHFSGLSTLMRGTGATTVAHLDLNKDGIVDTRIQVVQFSETGRAGSDGKLFSSNKPGFSISITPINPKSKGAIELDGNNVKVNPMYLSAKEDIDLLKLALEFCIDLLKSESLSPYILKIEEEEVIKNSPDIYINNNIFSGYHLIGGSQNAINSDFSVKGVKGLYVCDASIFNRYAASNIHSSVVLIADIFSKKFNKSNSNRL